MDKLELERLMDRAATEALEARGRIEAGVDAGELPVWLIETCNQWERAAMIYGAARAALDPQMQQDFDGLPPAANHAGSSLGSGKLTKN